MEPEVITDLFTTARHRELPQIEVITDLFTTARHRELPQIEVRAVITNTFNIHFNIIRLTPNDQYMGRTAPLTSKLCILYIYSTNIGTEYFKHALYSPFFFLFKMQFVS